MSFHSPHFLWLLALVAIPVVLGKLRGSPPPVPAQSDPAALHYRQPSQWSIGWSALLLVGGILLSVVALAGPHTTEEKSRLEMPAQRIVLVLDVSGSMLMEDFELNGERVNRLDAAKPAINDYLTRRSGDSVGLVVFGGEARLLSPLRPQAGPLSVQLEGLKPGSLKDGTAIGDALVAALGHLTDSDPGGIVKTIVLVSDGADNRSVVSPAEAMARVKARGVTAHTIGVGSEGLVPMPVFDEGGRKIGYRRALSDVDDHDLVEIASATGGQFFRARDASALKSAFASINARQNRGAVTVPYVVVTEQRGGFATAGASLLVLGGITKIFSRSDRRPLPA